MRVTIDGAVAVKELLVKAQASSGYIYLPKAWIGKRIKVVLLDDEKHTGVDNHEN